MNVLIEARTKGPLFATIVRLLSLIADEVNIHVDSNKLFIQAMDTSHISMFELTLDSSWFDKYTFEGTTLVLGVHLATISKILACRSVNQTIELISRSDSLDINFESDVSEEVNKYFSTSLYAFDQDLLCVPETEYDVDIKINSSQIHGIIGMLAQFGEVVRISCDETGITLNNTDTLGTGTKMTATIKMEDISEYAIVEGGKCESVYSLQCLALFASACKVAVEANIHFTSGLPLYLEYDVSETSTVKFWVSPRIEDD